MLIGNPLVYFLKDSLQFFQKLIICIIQFCACYSFDVILFFFFSHIFIELDFHTPVPLFFTYYSGNSIYNYFHFLLDFHANFNLFNKIKIIQYFWSCFMGFCYIFEAERVNQIINIYRHLELYFFFYHFSKLKIRVSIFGMQVKLRTYKK